MMDRGEVERAALSWRAAAGAVEVAYLGEPDYDYQRGLSEGYASALEMVLRGNPEPHDSEVA